jgi:3-deoxy-D-manno-octulosonic acid kinase
VSRQPAGGPGAIPAGYAAREVRNHLIVARPDVEQELGRYFTLAFEELAALPGAQRVAGGRAGPVHFQPEGVPGRIFVRPYAHGGLLGGARGLAFPDPSRALRELSVTARAGAAGLPVPPLLAVTATRTGPRTWTLCAWSRWLPNATSLSLALPGLAAAPASRAQLFLALADAIRRCHDAGLVHADLNARNLLVERAPDAWLIRVIDLDRAAFTAPLAPEARLAQLARLYRSLAKEGLLPGAVTPEDYGAFARAATGGALTPERTGAFLAGCARAVRRHALLWRLGAAWRRARGR